MVGWQVLCDGLMQEHPARKEARVASQLGNGLTITGKIDIEAAKSMFRDPSDPTQCLTGSVVGKQAIVMLPAATVQRVCNVSLFRQAIEHTAGGPDSLSVWAAKPQETGEYRPNHVLQPTGHSPATELGRSGRQHMAGRLRTDFTPVGTPLDRPHGGSFRRHR